MCVKIPISYLFTGPSQIITVTDPNTGQLVQQVVQTQIDPHTGEFKQVLSPLAASSTVNGGVGGGGVQVITVQDPVTGQLQQQVVGSSMNLGGGEGRYSLLIELCSGYSHLIEHFFKIIRIPYDKKWYNTSFLNALIFGYFWFKVSRA